jgi:hypothetical protein
MSERVDPEMLAYTMSEHVHDTEPDADAYLRGFVEELLSLEPGLRQHVSNLLIGDLKEEIFRDDTEFAAACRDAIVMVEQRWRSGR